MSRLSCTGWLVVGWWALAQAQSAAAQGDPNPDDSVAVWDTVAVGISRLRTVENKAFRVGEHLVFNIKYGFLKAGEAVMQILDLEEVQNRKCYRIHFGVKSVGLFSLFYKVEDRYETCLDVEGIFPWRYEQHIREGGYRRDVAAEFDQINHIAKTEQGKYPIPPYVHDIVSSFYYVRTQDFENARIGEKLHLHQFYKDSTYSLDVKFLGRQTVKVKAGKFRCIIVEPLVQQGGLFKRGGRIIIWLTDDEQKIPIKMTTKVPVGSIKAELREYIGVDEPIQARVK
ncbi:MAG: DUF3108 domain-containing protein [Bacteroidota bacterium]